MREVQYCFCLAEYYLKECSPPQPRFALQCLLASQNSGNNGDDITLQEKLLGNLRLAQMYYKYTENNNHTIDHIKQAVDFGQQFISNYNDAYKTACEEQTQLPPIHQSGTVMIFCPAEAYAESVLFYSNLLLPASSLNGFKNLQDSVDEAKRLLQNCLNELAACTG